MKCNDAELVSESLAGNREAFARIVEAYQSLICSLAYNATGSLCRSEDLAQETFVIAWKELRRLREPEKLRSWLCSIARSVISNASRRQMREPAHAAEPIETAQGTSAPGPTPSEAAIQREEEALLWRSIERIPEIYREPLILFYREEQSVARVAAKLELSEDAVKQRLSRGRKLLTDEVATFVEGILKRTTPGKTFTLGVLAALPLLGASSATAATAAGTAVKTSLAAKTAAVAGLVGAALGPLIGLLGGVCGAWFSIKNTRSPRERRFMIRQTWVCTVYVLLFLAAFFALIFLGKPLAAASPIVFGCAMGLLIVTYCVGLVAGIAKSNRRQRQIQIEDGTAAPAPITQPTFVSRKQRLWNLYGSLGGSIAGALAWIVVQAAQTKEWITASVTILFGLALVLFGGRACMRRPERRFRVMVQILALLGLFTLVVFLLHRREWTNAAGLWAISEQQVLLGCGLAAIFLLVGGLIWLKRKKRVRSKPGARSHDDLLAMILVPLFLSGVSCHSGATDKPKAESWTLPNGIRVVSVYFPGSTNVSIFSFLSPGLANDGPKQAQWSHLVEHLVIRSTVPKDLSIANAETLPDHMRLDFYGNLGNWKEGLFHHRRWLEGVPFVQTSLEAEKPKVKSECTNTASNLFTHKFAMAAWAQGFRHGETNAALLGDIDRVSLNDIQAYRDNRLAVLSNVVVCIVGGVDRAGVLPVVAAQLGGIKSDAKPVAKVKLHPGNREMTWDLNARHLLITWPIPAAEAEDFAPLLEASQRLNTRFYSDPEIKKLTGMALAGADLATPEGNFFYISASLRPGTSFQDVQAKLGHEVLLLSSSDEDMSMLPTLGRQLAQSLNAMPNLGALKAQLPPNMNPAMLEANIGLQWGMNEYRYGSLRTVLAKRLSELKAQDVQRAAENFLSGSKCSVISLRPVTP